MRGRRRDARACSEACRKALARGRRRSAQPRGCWACGRDLGELRADADVCSPRCRQRRARGWRLSRSERLARLYGIRPSDFWRTPVWLVAAAHVVYGPLAVDVSSCSDDAVLSRWIDPGANGLTTSWRAAAGGLGGAWWNPPYSPGLLPWVEKAAQESGLGLRSVGLIPPAMGARYMDLADQAAAEVGLISGRVPFLHPDTGEAVPGNRGDSCFVFFDELGPREKGARYRRWDLAELRTIGSEAIRSGSFVPNTFPSSGP